MSCRKEKERRKAKQSKEMERKVVQVYRWVNMVNDPFWYENNFVVSFYSFFNILIKEGKEYYYCTLMNFII